MIALRSFFFAGRLAWRQLLHDRAKLSAATLGVLFACVLVFMQLGFRDSLYTSAASAPLKMKADLFLMHKQTEAMWRAIDFNRAILMRALGHPEVVAVFPMYVGLAPFKNIETRVKRTLMVYGFNPDADLITAPGLAELRPLLKFQDYVAFDDASRPEFGPVGELLKQGRNVTEINDRKVQIVGTFRMGTSFASDGNIVTSELNFHRIFPHRTLDRVDLGFIQLREGADKRRVQEELRALLDDEVYVMTYDELVEYEQSYWRNNAPIGFIFGFGMVMGLIVGMVIVYQILFTDITNNLSEYATLKAMGYSHFYLIQVVFASALLLAVFGFLPGWVLSLLLYHLAEQKIYMPFLMPFSKVVTVFTFILAMCAGAGALAVRKLRAASPADMF